MQRLKSISFIKIALKLSYFCKKCKIFECWGTPEPPDPPDSRPPAAGGFAPDPHWPLAAGGSTLDPKNSPLSRISGYAPAQV